MNIPDTFQFYHFTDPECLTLYTATLDVVKKNFHVTWDGYKSGAYYSIFSVEHNIKHDKWKIHFAPTNNKSAQILLKEDEWSVK
jgi:hypothetical protein